MIIDIESDRFVREVIEKNEYAFLFKDLVVIDIGSNIGSFSYWIKDLAREVYAIDMVEENIESMNKTIADNKITNIKTFCVAIAGHSQDRKFVKDKVLGGGGSMIADSGEFTTKAMTLGQFMKDIPYANVVKIDVEGLEREIMEAPDFPYDKIGTVIGELHKPQHFDRIEVRDLLEKHGFRYTEVPGNHFVARKI
jgi:FkbM family methyltransferase